MTSNRRRRLKLTTKGQVTLPKDVRERHGLLPGTEVRFVDDGRTVRLEKADARPGSRH